jgi:hypothetical protein
MHERWLQFLPVGNKKNVHFIAIKMDIPEMDISEIDLGPGYIGFPIHPFLICP